MTGGWNAKKLRWLALSVLTGCGGGPVSVGTDGPFTMPFDGPVISTSECVGARTDCSTPRAATVVESVEPRECELRRAGPLPSELTFRSEHEKPAGYVGAADGSLWIYGWVVTSSGQDSVTAVWMEHLDSSGRSLGRNDRLVTWSDPFGPFIDLAPNPNGGATLYLYRDMAVDQGERILGRVFVLNDAASVLTGPLNFRYAGGGRVAGSSDGTFTVAISPPERGTTARLARFSALGEGPLFIQSNVPSFCWGNGVGATSLASNDDGGVTVLSDRTIDDTLMTRQGLSRFDAEGNLVSNWELPMLFFQQSVGMVRSPGGNGTVFVHGSVPTTVGPRDVIQGYSASEGRPIFAWSLVGPSFMRRPLATRIGMVTLAQNPSAMPGVEVVAAVAADGTSCAVFDSPTVVTAVAVAGDHVFYVTSGEIIHRVPLAVFE